MGPEGTFDSGQGYEGGGSFTEGPNGRNPDGTPSGFNPFSVGIAIAQGIAPYAGQQSTNTANAQEAEKNRQFQSGEAVTARRWSEQMRDSAWQSTVSGMRKAGVNPMVAFQQGPVSTPSGPMPGGVGNPTMENSLAKGLQGAMSSAQSLQDLRTQQSQQALNQAQAVTQAATAYRETANAKQAEMTTAAMTRDWDSKAAEAAKTKREAEIDLDTAKVRKYLDIGTQTLGGVTSALNPIGSIIRSYGQYQSGKAATNQANEKAAAFQRAYPSRGKLP